MNVRMRWIQVELGEVHSRDLRSTCIMKWSRWQMRMLRLESRWLTCLRKAKMMLRCLWAVRVKKRKGLTWVSRWVGLLSSRWVDCMCISFQVLSLRGSDRRMKLCRGEERMIRWSLRFHLRVGSRCRVVWGDEVIAMQVDGCRRGESQMRFSMC